MEIVNELLVFFDLHGCNMSIKSINLLFSRLEKFCKNLGDVSDEKGEGFHQNIKVMEECYQGHLLAWRHFQKCDDYFKKQLYGHRKLFNTNTSANNTTPFQNVYRN